MRAIEEYKVSGTIDEEKIDGKVTAFITTITKIIPLGLRTVNLKMLDKFEIFKRKTEEIVEEPVEEITKQVKTKKEIVITNITNFTKDNPGLAKRVLTGALIVVMSTSFTGCKIEPLAKNTPENNIEYMTEHEQTAKIDYFIMSGDTLEGIVRRYKDNDIKNEVNKICIENNIVNPNNIQSGTTIKLNVPISKLEVFDYTYILGEVKEWEAMDYFVDSAFSQAKVHPDNLLFLREKEEATDYLRKAANARYDLELMNGAQLGFYTEEDIKNKEQELLGYYTLAVEITEQATGKKYGVDYQIEPPVEVMPLEKSFGK